jgi:hypothetical protein
MQKQRDDIDILIEKSFKEINVSDDYNSVLLSKIKEREHKKSVMEIFNFNKSSLRISAVSLILGGIMIALLNVPEIQYKVIDYQYKIKSAEVYIQYNYNLNISNFFKGE